MLTLLRVENDQLTTRHGDHRVVVPRLLVYLRTLTLMSGSLDPHSVFAEAGPRQVKCKYIVSAAGVVPHVRARLPYVGLHFAYRATAIRWAMANR